ncbi:MaoC/PaaZ C-terminal domain-containing protein [Maricaulis sp.]|uniref:MaoC family dehydratase n=1 Tax=unclassified Maricaulis TaxID=2632371 RepID=UPI001B08FC7A|nr:MaoC/PaaZ C-terminal domain-containing protein [Maricaulis sp.]MBO6796079.1 hydratase [Maricaulis sp.]
MSRAVRELSFTQDDFDAFARLSGDDNPIHVDPEFSAHTRFGKTVAHGALLCSVLRGLVEELAPGARQIRQSTMYPAPSPAGTPLRFEAEMTSETPENMTISLKVIRLEDGETTCLGETEIAR